jgi:3-methyl-2-oxobutanoate hydroxymethyltransferase
MSSSGIPVAITDFAEMKQRGDRIVMVTAYDFPSARLADAAGVDIVFTGDSAANNVLGYPDTTPISMDEMVMLGRATRRGTHRAFFLVDMPLGAFQVSDEDAVRNAMRLVKDAGAQGVKLEGAGPMVARARAIVAAGVPVMGHLGLTPQTATALGGYKAQGRTAEAAAKVAREALALQEAGCFSIVFEAIPSAVSVELMPQMRIPVIGIGAGPATDGQVLVFHDLLGIREGLGARFVKRYANLLDDMAAGVAAFADDVRERRYPGPEHGYSIPEEEIAGLRAELRAG